MGQAKQRGTRDERVAAAVAVKEQTPPRQPRRLPTTKTSLAMAMLLGLGVGYGAPTVPRLRI